MASNFAAKFLTLILACPSSSSSSRLFGFLCAGGLGGSVGFKLLGVGELDDCRIGMGGGAFNGRILAFLATFGGLLASSELELCESAAFKRLCSGTPGGI